MRMPWERLPGFLADAVKKSAGGDIYEIRLRLSQPIEICAESGNRLVGGRVTSDDIDATIASLTGHSVYACEAQMKDGFFTLPGGARVGLAGRYSRSGGELQCATSLSIRIPRGISALGDRVMEYITLEGGVKSCLILSPPRMGKTTLLRALIEKSSDMGFHVAVADERDELAGGESLGSRVDVMANCLKREAIPKLVRAMSPDIVATDEIGHPEDAEIIADARRCGCAVFATAHAGNYQTAKERGALKTPIGSGVFDLFVELGRSAGHVVSILDEGGRALWTDGA